MSSISQRSRRLVAFFFKASDTSPREDPGALEKWADLFSPECRVNLAGKVLQTRQELHQHRATGWRTVIARRHRLEEVYEGTGGRIMLHGAWEYDGLDGNTSKGTWAGRMVLGEDEGGYVGLRVKEYQTWMVSRIHSQG